MKNLVTAIFYLKLIKKVSLTVMLFTSVLCVGQDFQEDFKLIQNANNRENFKVEYKIEITRITAQGRDSLTKVQGVSSQYKNKSYNQLGQGVTFIQDSVLIQINNQTKEVVIMKTKGKALKKTHPALPFEKVSSASDSVVFLGLNEGVKSYSIYSKQGILSYTKIALDLNGNLKEVEVVYRATYKGVRKTKMYFNNYTEVKSKEFFLWKISDFLVEKEDGFDLSEKYKHYTLINYL